MFLCVGGRLFVTKQGGEEMEYLPALAGVVIGNFIYQFIKENPDYSTAIERSFFICAGALILMIIKGNQ